MTGPRALRETLTQGGRVEWDEAERPHLLVPPGLRSQLEPHRTILQEILQRATVLRQQALQFILKGIAMPILALPDLQGSGGCLSCGATVETGQYRCELCVIAVKLALQGLDYPWFWVVCSAVPPRPGSDALSVPCVPAKEDS